MNEITKLYENTGIKPKQKGYCDCDCDCPYPHHKCGDECPYWKYEDEAKYPPFTAEKQIKLTQKIWEHRPNIYPNFDLLINHSYGEMIATFVNHRWQDLTEEERKQIKEILSE